MRTIFVWWAARGEVEGERAWVEDRRAEIDAIRTQAQQEVHTFFLPF
jgi:ketosteroid isomerase-like protein